MTPRLRVAVIGATGLVGGEIARLIEQRRFPCETTLFASGDRPRKIPFRGHQTSVFPASPGLLQNFDLALLATEDGVARRLVPPLLRAGTLVIDESSAFRMNPKVPLVIPEINGQVLRPDHRLIAGPNCTTSILLMGIYPIHRNNPVSHIRAATYQAVSGAGREAVGEMVGQVSAWRRSRPWGKARALPRPIAFNVFPQVGTLDEEGRCSEELKIAREARKILEAPDLQVSAAAIRVPVFRGHSIAVWIETENPITPRRARSLLARSPGVELWASRRGVYPTPLEIGGRCSVGVGRVRRGSQPRELLLWVVGDNLLKGAALNSIQIAEFLLAKGWLRPK